MPTLPLALRRIRPLGLCLLAALLARDARGMDYGPFEAGEGESVTFEAVSESGDAELERPTRAGDTLIFSPTAFSAESVGGGTVTVGVTVDTVLHAIDGRGLERLSLTALTDSDFVRLGVEPTEATRVSLEASFAVEVLAVDGQETTGTVFNAAGPLKARRFGTSASDAPDMELVLDLRAAADAAGITGRIDRANWTVDLELIASSEDVSAALIQLNRLNEIVLAVPEPATASLALIGGVSLLLRRRPA